MNPPFDRLLADVLACRHCEALLPEAPRPVLQCHPDARLLIAGQAPGRKAHAAGKPFADASGDRLRDWLGLDEETFYNPRRVAILPMGFCYPGSGRAGDLPPRPECAPRWRAALLDALPAVRMTLVIGQYALRWHLPGSGSVSEAVGNWRAYWPRLAPLPHPSPRNQLWLRRHPWFETDLLPALRAEVARLMEDPTA